MADKKKNKKKGDLNADLDESLTESAKAREKKVIYIDIDDEITAVYDKILDLTAEDIYIVAPKRSAIFQSIINLKILKRKTEKEGKQISFITNDQNGVYLAKQLNIPVFDKPNGNQPSLTHLDFEGDDKISPLKASVNSIEEEAPVRVEKKISISQIIRRKKDRNFMDISSIENPLIARKIKMEKPRLVIVSPNRHALIGLLTLTLFILLVVIYVALPGVTIYLTPTASVLEKSVNITLADFQKNRSELETNPNHVIASYPLSTIVKKSLTYKSTGKKFSNYGSNSQGKIIIYNNTKDIWPLIPRTRFQNEDGIVFRINDYVNVPPAKANGPGLVEAFVVADEVDAYGAIVGEKGNIGPGKFFLPGLKESSRDKVYAENKEAMTGGVTDYKAFISAEDLEAARQKLADDLQKSAIEELKKLVEAESSIAGSKITYSLLQGDGAIKTGEVKMVVPENLINREVKEFTITGEIAVSGVYYDHDRMLEILKNELMLKKSPQKELLQVNENSTSYKIFEWNEGNGKIKLTANIKGIEQFELNDEEEPSPLLGKIRDHILGRDIETAKLYIQNLPEINKVEIERWPAWAPTIPNIPDNIKFKIREAVVGKP